MKLLDKSSLRLVQIEDADDFAHLTNAILRHRGFAQAIMRFEHARSALDYLSQAEASRLPDAILLDLNMPGMSGLEMLRWLRTGYRDNPVPVFVLTSSESREDKRLALEIGATGFFSKDELNHGLLQALDEMVALHNHRHREALEPLDELMTELALQGEYAGDMVALADPEGRIVWTNDVFLRVCGYRLEELRGQNPGQLLQGPESDPAVVQVLHEAVQATRPCQCELVNYRKNGEPYRVHISLGPIFRDGTHRGFLSIERDLSVGPGDRLAA